jgi:hypothetical protein
MAMSTVMPSRKELPQQALKNLKGREKCVFPRHCFVTINGKNTQNITI